MPNDELVKIFARILREAGAPGAEHERLKAELTQWAIGLGYATVYTRFESGSEPDVLRGNKEFHHLFVGDAKDASNETVDNADTLKRLHGYFVEYASLLGPEAFAGGHLAIATNDGAEASRWCPVLNTLARTANLTGASGARPDFQSVETNPGRTWIVSW